MNCPECGEPRHIFRCPAMEAFDQAIKEIFPVPAWLDEFFEAQAESVAAMVKAVEWKMIHGV